MTALLIETPRRNQGLIDHWSAQISRLESLISESSEEEKQVFEDTIVRLRAEIEQAEEN